MSRIWLCAGAALTAAVLAIADYYGEVPAAVVVAVVVVAFSVGWPYLIELPDPIGSAISIGVCGLGAGAGLIATRDDQELGALVLVLGLSVLVVFIHELTRVRDRSRLVTSVAGTSAGAVLAILAAAWLARPAGDSTAGVAAAATLAIGCLTATLPLRRPALPILVAVVSLAAGGVLAYVTPGLEIWYGLSVGACVAGLLALLVGRLHFVTEHRPLLGQLAAVVAPVAFIAVPVYYLTRLLVG